MAKPKVQEARFDFRKGRNTAISPDLLNPDELVDTTNCRLVDSYGAITKRTGTQRIHATAFPAAVNGVTQWDSQFGKQTVVISNGDLYYRDSPQFSADFIKANSPGTARSTAWNANAQWSPTSFSDSGGVPTSRTTTGVVVCTLGDPAAGNNIDASDDLYTIRFRLHADGTAMSGTYAAIDASVTADANIDGGGYNPIAGGGWLGHVSTSLGSQVTQDFTVVVSIPGAPAVSLLIRLNFVFSVAGLASGNASASVTVGSGFPVTWTTGGAKFSTSDPAIFAPFRASTAGAPLVLYIASGGHYFKWTGGGGGAGGLSQLDPLSGAATMLPTNIISYHTRMFAMSASGTTPGLLPKTIFWSKIGDAETFSVLDKTFGGSAVTDFLTGQRLTALEVVGSSLLLATVDSVMRFTGQSSDDIVISQNTEGVSAEVGVVGMLAFKRFENVAALLAQRGPYIVNDTSVEPIGEQVLPDFDALDSANVSKSVLIYHRGRKELWYAVPRASDGGLNKTIFPQSVRLQSWYGPWAYSFGITCMANYIGTTGIENVIAGCSDGFVRLMDVGFKDDVLNDGTGGTNITMTAELPTLHFGDPGITKTLRQEKLQAKLPAGHNFKVKTAFDGDALQDGSFVDTTFDGTLRDYRVDLDGQGKRCRKVYTDDSAVAPQINGFIMQAYDMQRP